MLYIGTPSSEAIQRVMSAGGLACMTTPAQGNKIPPGAKWAADNGKFGNGWPGDGPWFEWLEAKVTLLGPSRCLFATAPDVVGDAVGTLAESAPWLPRIRSLHIPAAFVAQDGSRDQGLIPWGEFDVLFLGGSDAFKLGREAEAATRDALSRGLRVHMGRVNSRKRLQLADAWGVHTADGTYLRFGPTKNLPRLLRWLEEINRPTLF